MEEKKKFTLPTPKTTRERMEWLRENSQKFVEEEALVNEVVQKPKPK
jgi:hypothetical protein